MQNKLILRLEESRTRLVRVGEAVRGEAIERELQLLESLETLLEQLQERIRAERERLLEREPSERRFVLPIAGYDELTAKQVLAELTELDETQRAAVRDYEREHKNRKTVLRALEAA